MAVDGSLRHHYGDLVFQSELFSDALHMTTKPKTTRRVKDEKEPCLLCGKLYKGENSSDCATTCLWIHIFRKDKYFKALMRPITSITKKR